MRANFAVFCVFFSLMIIVAVFSERRYNDMLLTVLFAVCGSISAIYQIIKPTKKYKSADGDLTLKEFSFPTIDEGFRRLESRISFFKKMRLWNEKQLTKLVPGTGSSYDVERASTISTRISILSFFPCVISGVLLIQYVGPISLALCSVIPVAYFSQYVKLRFVILERKTKIEEEMAYFLCYVNIMQTIGLSLYRAYESIRGHGVFPGFEKDSNEIVKRVEMIGITQNDSLTKYADTHPSIPFQEFVRGYIAKITSIGNVPAYTESKAKYFFDEYIGKWHRYEKSAQEIFSAIIMIAIILPMMILFNSMLGSVESSALMLFIGTIISPIVSLLMIVMLNNSQPATGNTMRISPLPLAAGGVAGMAAFVAGMDTATSIAIACMLGAGANHFAMRSEMKKTRTVDGMMPEFMRDVTEMSKTGDNIHQIVLKQARKKAYKGHFNTLLEGIASRVSVGVPFETASQNNEMKSTHFRFIMFLLSKTYTTGGGNPDIFHSITDFISRIGQTKDAVTKSLRSMTMLVYFSPFLMLGISHMMIAMFSGVETGDVGSGPFSGGLTFDENMIDRINIMTVMTTVPIGAVAAKISSFTVKDTMPVALSALCTIIAIQIIPIIVGNFGF